MPSLPKHRSKKRKKENAKDARNQTKHIKLDKSPKVILQPQTTNKPAKVQSKLIFTPIKSTNIFKIFLKLKTTSIDLSLRDYKSMSVSLDKSVYKINYLKQIGILLKTIQYQMCNYQSLNINKQT